MTILKITRKGYDEGLDREVVKKGHDVSNTKAMDQNQSKFSIFDFDSTGEIVAFSWSVFSSYPFTNLARL